MTHDVLVIGAGPGGLSVASGLARAGACVQVIDEQPYAGGQIFRASEKSARAGNEIRGWLGEEYSGGLDLIRSAKRQERIDWQFATSVWDIRCEDDHIELGLVHGETASITQARHVVLASGAMERPAPFKGWTLPGVMGIGAAQTLFKDAGLVPENGVVLAGSGPLLYLFANQLLSAGVRPGAILDFAAKWVSAQHLVPLTRVAWHSRTALLKGLKWRSRIARAGIPHLFGVDELEAVGKDEVQGVHYRKGGQSHQFETSLLLVHDGVIPNTHMTVAAGCDHNWLAQQQYWQPGLNDKGQTSQQGLWVVGDCAGIMGAEAAEIQGRIVARNIAGKLGLAIGKAEATQAQKDLAELKKLAALRQFIDLQYPPAKTFATPADDTVICRCEAVTAGEIREIAQLGCQGPNQARAFTRAGMGPCMGRGCGLSVSRLMAEVSGNDIEQVGHYSTRTPLKPVTLSQLASLNDT
ncbi:MAG: FAD-dependent oxidoreductase [Rhodobacteraceae bacterium]|nr:FAD-dependent oxidoreductase [Paracoccaceae bacterium]